MRKQDSAQYQFNREVIMALTELTTLVEKLLPENKQKDFNEHLMAPIKNTLDELDTLNIMVKSQEHKDDREEA